MSVFVDTSALYALLDRDDRAHAASAAAWSDLLKRAVPRPLLTTNYVLLETTALLQRRLGLAAVRDLEERIVPLLTPRWIAEALHRRAMDRLIRGDRRAVSLVDCTSFEVMEREGIGDAFAIDAHFAEEGFRLIPGAASK